MRIRCLFVSLVMVGCGDSSATQDAAPDAVDYTIGEHPQLAMSCSDAAADIHTLPSNLPAMDDSHRGDVFRCAKAEKLTVPEIKAQIDKDNLPYPAATPGIIQSGFWTYRIAYRTTRVTVGTARAEGDSAATLIIPARPIPGAPLVVVGHGSTGFAEKCAPSRLDLSAAIQDLDYPPMLYRLAGYGYTVIAPDYAGFSYGQPPGYFNAEDEAHSVLDATRAAAKILPTAPDKVVFVGHSQGGHAVISAHSYAKSYGMAGELVGVATMAPLWSSMSLFAAATTPAAGLTTSVDTGPILYAMAYAYSASELREGEGHGVDVFQTAKQAAAKTVLFGSECYDKAAMETLGATPADFFETSYVNIVGSACAVNPFSPDCSDPLAAKWKARWIEDRPPIDPQGAPHLIVYGGLDTFVTPGRAQCARNKFDKDLASGATTSITYCYNSKAAHRDIMRGPDAGYINEWIAARAGAGPEPSGACAPFPTTVTCSTPPNDY